MRIAITGGSGRIGRAVINLALAQGHDVVSIDRVPAPPDLIQPNITHVRAEITNYPELERALHECDAVVHLAAIPSPHGRPDYEVHHNNVVGSYNVLSAAARLGIKRVCQASSINAIGGFYSRWVRYDYLPVDEAHPSYNQDPYSLSKWLAEQQADSFARQYESMTIASLRLHWIVQERANAKLRDSEPVALLPKQLWGYTRLDAAARACLLSLTAVFTGHEVFYIVAADTMVDQPSLELKQQFFPDVPARAAFEGRQGFFNTQKAQRILGWQHDEH